MSSSACINMWCLVPIIINLSQYQMVFLKYGAIYNARGNAVSTQQSVLNTVFLRELAK